MNDRRPTAPRLPPVPREERDAEMETLLAAAHPPAGAAGGQAPNIFTTLVRHPKLFRRWIAFGGALLAGTLPRRDRELLVLRTAWRCRSAYEWGQHVLIAQAAGLTGDDVERVRRGPHVAGWDPFDAALLRAADGLCDQSRIADGVWAVLAARYDEHQLIELPMLVGHYQMLAGTLNSLGVEPDQGVPMQRWDA